MSDQFYHEYPELIDQFISQAIPYSSSREKQVIRKFVHCGGLPGNQIAETIPKLWEGLLVLEWKGTLEKGRAFLIKRMLTRGNIPILLVRHQEQGKSKLKVGRSFEAA